MTLLKIAQIGEPVLRQRAEHIPIEELQSARIQSFIDDLIETMRDARGAGLAANQVFMPLRICAIEVRDNPRYPYKPNYPLTVLVNPELVIVGSKPAGESFSNFEGCLSVPNLRGRVRRACAVRVRALNRHGEPITIDVRGLTAGTFQHELDHLDGVLFVDKLEDPRSLCTWEAFERYHLAEFADEARALVARFGA